MIGGFKMTVLVKLISLPDYNSFSTGHIPFLRNNLVSAGCQEVTMQSSGLLLLCHIQTYVTFLV